MGTATRGHAFRDAFSFVGGVTGLMVFLTTTLEAALVYGGAAGVSMLHGLGLQDPAVSVTSRLIVWIGMLLGAFATAAVMVVLGAALGALLHGLVGPGKPRAGEEES